MDEPIALAPGEGGAVKADRPELSLLEITFAPGSGVDPHFHKGHSASFYLLEGELEFHVGTRSSTRPPGPTSSRRRTSSTGSGTSATHRRGCSTCTPPAASS